MKKVFLNCILLLCALIVGSGSLWGQSDKSAVYTSDVTLSTTGGTSASTCKVRLSSSGTQYDGIKCGTGSAAGAMKLTAPAGTKYLHVHLVAWNGDGVTVSITPNSNITPTSFSLTSDAGISGSSPFTLSTPANATSSYYKVITFSSALEKETQLTFTATSGKRFVIWGVNKEEDSGSAIPTTTTIDATGITNTDLKNGTAAGSLSASVTVTSGGASVGGATVTWSSSDEGVATIASNGIVTLASAGETTITASYAGDEEYGASSKTYVLTVSDTRTATTTEINVPGDFNTELATSPIAGTLSAVVKVGGSALDPQPSVTWTSSKTAVATVDENTGAVTLVAKGTTTITASYAGSATQKPSSDTYELTVTNKHNGIFYVNGNVYQTVLTNQDSNIEFPSNPEDRGEMLFMGWSESETDGYTTIIPTLVSSKKMGAQDIPFYAVFASNVEIVATDVLTRETTGVSKGSTTYTGWSGKKSNSDAVYAGNSAGGQDAIQLRTQNSNSGIITTTSGGLVRKVTVAWESTTSSERVLGIYGKKSAYSAASDLYSNNTQGTKLGDIAYVSSTELTIVGADFYDYIGIRSNSGALWLTSVTIQWVDYSNANYFTTIPETVSKTITAAGWATYCSPFALDLEHATGLTDAFIVRGGAAGVLDKVSVKSGIVPANTGLLLKAPAGTATAATIPIVNSGTTDVSKNKLVGKTEEYLLPAGEGYVLLNGDNGIGFYINPDAAFTIGANTAYLPVGFTGSNPDAAPSSFRIVDEENNATNINSINANENVIKFIENGQLLIKKNGIVYDAIGRVIRK